MLGQSFNSNPQPPLRSIPSAERLSSAEQDPSYTLALVAAQVADERQGGNIVWLAVEEVSILADYFLIVTGYSTTQVRAIARAIEDRVLETCQRQPKHIEGFQAGSWILMDYGDVIVHVLLESEREFYDLEAFWGHAPRIPYPLPTAS